MMELKERVQREQEILASLTELTNLSCSLQN